MRPDPVPPLVPVCACLVAGAAWGGARPAACAAALVLSLALAWLARGRPRLVIAAAMAAGACAGAGAQAIAWREAQVRFAVLAKRGAGGETDLIGRVLAAPERRLDGSRSILLAPEVPPSAVLRVDVAFVPPDDRTRLDALRRGDVVRVWCRIRPPRAGPGVAEAEARRRLAAQRLDATARVKSSRLVREVRRGRLTPGRLLDELHAAAIRRLDAAFAPEGTTRAVLGAMVLGDRGLLAPELNALLRDAGLVHLLSISGLHTAMTVLVLLSILRRGGAGPRGVLVAGGASLVAFAALVGHGASVWRACASLGVVLVARAAGRDVEGLGALALASAALVLAVPPLAWNVGFLLSALATAGLLVAARSAGAGETRGAVFRGLAVSGGAYAATMPLLARSFGRLAPVALLANLVAAPLCAACLASGSAAIVFAGVPGLGALSAGAAELAVRGLVVAAQAAAAVPGGHLRVASPGAVAIALYAALLAAAYVRSHPARSPSARALRLAAMLVAIAMHLGGPPAAPRAARVEILDVGQGLSVLLRGPDGGVVLYDAGPTGGGRFDTGDRIVVPALAARACRRVAVLALSHDHDDHAGGARAVLRDREVGELWLPAGSERDRLLGEIAADAIARGVAVRRMPRGRSARAAGWSLDVLHPAVADRTRPINDRCLVLRATAGGSSVLLPGDLEAGGERLLLASGESARAMALVAPHHGADGSSTAAFLAAIGARVVAVSAGAGNRFGHPGAAALGRYAAAGMSIARTDLQGTIALEAAGSGWTLAVDDEGSRDEGENEDDAE